MKDKAISKIIINHINAGNLELNGICVNDLVKDIMSTQETGIMCMDCNKTIDKCECKIYPSESKQGSKEICTCGGYPTCICDIVKKSKETLSQHPSPNIAVQTLAKIYDVTVNDIKTAIKNYINSKQNPTAMEQVREAFEPIQQESTEEPINIFKIIEDRIAHFKKIKYHTHEWKELESALLSVIKLVPPIQPSDKEHSEKLGEKIQPSVGNCDNDCNGPDCEGCRDFKPKEQQPNKERVKQFIFNHRHNIYLRFNRLEPDKLKMICDMLQEYTEAYSKKSRGEIIEDWMEWYYEDCGGIDAYTKKYIKQYLKP